ncbi:MAG: RNA polymerase sigma factor [Candidatus Didemnitutus sp.]|nr:RNA polymerase sigma factor [Candidatus Didemnitutus sp.]
MNDVPVDLVARAQSGDRSALADLVRAIQPQLFALCLRMLWQRQDAEDACQEILVRVVTRLSTFRGESRFSTWLYRVALRHLIDFRRSCAEKAVSTFEAFAEDLHRGAQEPTQELRERPDYNGLLHEVRTGCSLAMLLCLDRPHRAAYVVGEIFEFDHLEAARALGVSAPTFRKRLSRARARVREFTQRSCGLVNAGAACRCARRVAPALALGRIDPAQLQHTTPRAAVRPFEEVEHAIRALQSGERTVALFRAQSLPDPVADFALTLDSILAGLDQSAARLGEETG